MVVRPIPYASALVLLGTVVACGSAESVPEVDLPTKPSSAGTTPSETPAGPGSAATPDASRPAVDASGPRDADDPKDASTTPPDDGSVTTPDDASRTTTTTVRVHHPDAARISIRGATAGLTWSAGAPCVVISSDTCELSLSGLTADFEWKPLVADTTWSRGPNYVAKVGRTTDVYPHFTTVRGSISTFDPAFASSFLTRTRRIRVYLPPTYAENTAARFPVLYMHDGQNLFDASGAFGGTEWRVDETLDTGAEDGTIREVIVVAIDNTSDRMEEYTPSRDPDEGFGGEGDAYLSLVATELKPRIDRDLRTMSGRSDTAILGSSLGGLISVRAGTTRAATFGRIGAMSPSTWWNGAAIVPEVLAMGAVRPDAVYVDSGDGGSGRGDDVANTARLAAAFRTLGYVDGKDLLYVMQPGGQHNEASWASRLPKALAFLVGPGR